MYTQWAILIGRNLLISMAANCSDNPNFLLSVVGGDPILNLESSERNPSKFTYYAPELNDLVYPLFQSETFCLKSKVIILEERRLELNLL